MYDARLVSRSTVPRGRRPGWNLSADDAQKILQDLIREGKIAASDIIVVDIAVPGQPTAAIGKHEYEALLAAADPALFEFFELRCCETKHLRVSSPQIQGFSAVIEAICT